MCRWTSTCAADQLAHPCGPRSLQIDFDLVGAPADPADFDGADRGFALEPMSVASFYRRCVAELAAAGVEVVIDVLPNEVPNPIRFPMTRCTPPTTQPRWPGLLACG